MEEKSTLDRDGVDVSTAGGSSSEVRKELHDHNPSTAELVRDIDGGIEERKLKSRKFLGQSTAKEVVSSMQMSSESASSSSSPSSTGAENYFGKSSLRRGKRMSAIDCESTRIRSPRRSVRVKMGGFVAFNADYHVPKPHPPRNN
ncbi:hypothetical protein BT93_B0399 [Corymbia citriodora subsp. variegata]|nr:hypothetical protein BT93_B0399 [Corymbia citriodora subsp. variegata]